MRKVKIKELTKDSFAAYGTFARMIDPDTEKIGEAPIEFYRDMVPLNLGQNNIASFSVCRVSQRNKVINTCEYHTYTGEGILPLDGDILIHVGPAAADDEVPLGKIEVFRVPSGTMVVLRPGVWHHAPFANDIVHVNVLIVLPERTYANDCSVVELKENEHIKIEE